MKNNFRSQALSIAALGFRVVPHGTVEPNRHPLVKDWPNVATREPRQIDIWSAAFAFVKPSVGIVAGDSSIWAIDADEPEWFVREREDAGFTRTPRTAMVRSGGGGFHVYFKHDAYSRRKLIALGNVFVKGTRRDKAVELFVHPHALLAPGTIHQKTGKRYEWIHEMRPAVAPRKFVDLIAALPWARPEVSLERGSGYWMTEALEAFLTALGVEYEAGRTEGQFRVPCPWNSDHSTPSDALTDKTTVFIRDGWPCFSCFSSACGPPDKKTFGDFRRHHDPLRIKFSIDSWLSAEGARIRKEFRRGKR